MSEISLEKNPTRSRSQLWYNPIFSPEHGIYVMLLVCVLIGAAVAQNWTISTTLAFVCAFCGFQAEHPLVLQIRQRSSLKPRFIVWGSLYAGIAAAIAAYLYLQAPILIWIYLAAIVALVIDAISVFYREQKSIANELITFAAVCLTIPLTEAATVGTISPVSIGLWLLTTLFFSSTIFTVKLRKPRENILIPGLVYHAIALLSVIALWWFSWINAIAALAFGIALLKFSVLAWQQDWYRNAKIQNAAIIETSSASMFVAIVALSILPAHL